MKNPNRYGTVTKLSGNRRRPYIVKEGISGQQKSIGYAATREEALIMLAEYNNSPWDIGKNKVTFSELFNAYVKKRFEKLGNSTKKALNAAYKKCSDLYDVEYSSIRAYQMQNCIDRCEGGSSTKAAVKNLFYHMDRFAYELDIISKRYSDLLTCPSAPESNKQIFTDSEVNILWGNIETNGVDSVIFLLYTGFRITEMLLLKVEDVNIEQGTIKGGIKTAAGKNRLVPIHSKIADIVKKHMEQSQSGYLFEYNCRKYSENAYRKLWEYIMQEFNMNHTPHECRHTFRSRLDSAGANSVCIDRIMGHASSGTGERIYTHKTIQELKNTIELITN